MKLFKRQNQINGEKPAPQNQTGLAEMALKNIHDGVIIIDKTGVIKFINPAALTMTEFKTTNDVIGLDYSLVIKLESKEGRELKESENPLIRAIKANQPLESFQACLIVGNTTKRIPVAISVLPVNDLQSNHIITFRNIAKELAEEGEQTEFISTASHEMRTPVATIDGYLSLALNPQTATIDERARGYLSAAQAASKHLGKLFQDLLDVTKLDDGQVRAHFVPTEMIGFVRSVCNDYSGRAKEANLNFRFGAEESTPFGDGHRVEQVVYGSIDLDFMREILDNLIENAIKYTPSGGSVYVNVRGDGDRVLINVTDTGIGISSDDLNHVFQKFYRADNSDTRTIGGTGLGLYLVKQRTEAMGGRVWAESGFGEGSTFFVSLPRLTGDEYEKRMIDVRNKEATAEVADSPMSQTVQPIQSAIQPQPQPQFVTQSQIQPQPQTQTQPQPQPQPIVQPPAQPQPQPPVQPQPHPQSQFQSPVIQPQPQPQPQTIQPVQNQINNNLNGGTPK